MRIIEGMANKIKVQPQVELKQYTQEELDSACYAIGDLYVATVVQWLPIQKQQPKNIVVKHIKDSWYMDITNGNYYQECHFIDRAKHNVSYISSKMPFEYRYYEVLKNKKISTWATLPLSYFKDIIEDDKKLLIK